MAFASLYHSICWTWFNIKRLVFFFFKLDPDFLQGLWMSTVLPGCAAVSLHSENAWRAMIFLFLPSLTTSSGPSDSWRIHPGRLGCGQAMWARRCLRRWPTDFLRKPWVWCRPPPRPPPPRYAGRSLPCWAPPLPSGVASGGNWVLGSQVGFPDEELS